MLLGFRASEKFTGRVFDMIRHDAGHPERATVRADRFKAAIEGSWRNSERFCAEACEVRFRMLKQIETAAGEGREVLPSRLVWLKPSSRSQAVLVPSIRRVFA